MRLYHQQHAGLLGVGGDGVVGMVDKYERDGGLFLHYQNERYEGRGEFAKTVHGEGGGDIKG
jgi:hypothetical protein